MMNLPPPKLVVLILPQNFTLCGRSFSPTLNPIHIVPFLLLNSRPKTWRLCFVELIYTINVCISFSNWFYYDYTGWYNVQLATWLYIRHKFNKLLRKVSDKYYMRLAPGLLTTWRSQFNVVVLVDGPFFGPARWAFRKGWTESKNFY